MDTPHTKPEPAYHLPPSGDSTPLTTPKRHRRGLIWGVMLGFIVALGGGGYYAYSQELVVIPYIPTPTERLVSNLFAPSEEASSVTAESTMSIDFEAPASSSNSNTNADELGLGLGSANSLENLFDSFGFSATSTEYVKQGETLEDTTIDATLKASITFGETETDFTLLFRLIDGGMYLMLSDIETEIEPLKELIGKWVAIDAEKVDEYVKNANQAQTNQRQSINIEALQDQGKVVLSQALRDKAVTIQKVLTEDISGQPADKYSIKANASKLAVSLGKAIQRLEKQGQDLTYWQELKNALAQDSFREVINNTSFSLWVDVDERFARKLEAMSRLLMPTEAGGAMRMRYGYTVNSIGENRTVEKPTETIPFEEATGPLFLGILGASMDVLNEAEGDTSLESQTEDADVDAINEFLETTTTDSDSDGLPDTVEMVCQTNPILTDSDNDGFNDLTEVLNGFNPNGSGTAESSACLDFYTL